HATSLKFLSMRLASKERDDDGRVLRYLLFPFLYLESKYATTLLGRVEAISVIFLVNGVTICDFLPTGSNFFLEKIKTAVVSSTTRSRKNQRRKDKKKIKISMYLLFLF
ncbi:hypothetical protein ACJX0J_032778, partial [Zea mays]